MLTLLNQSNEYKDTNINFNLRKKKEEMVQTIQKTLLKINNLLST